MLHDFLSEHRTELIDRCREKAAIRASATPARHWHGIPLFLDELIGTLRREELRPHAMVDAGDLEIATSAARHGDELLRSGIAISQVVHEYGDLCQAVTEMATRERAAITAKEFGTLNRCLDEAIAAAIEEFGRGHDQLTSDACLAVMRERLGSFAHELRNLIGNAILAVAVIKHGAVGMGGATGALLDRSLVALRELVNRTLTDIQRDETLSRRSTRIDVADLVADVQSAAALEAAAAELEFAVAPIETGLAIEGDRLILAGSIANLLQNALKFTRAKSRVSLAAYRGADDDVLIEVADQCGGLLAGHEDDVFLPFARLAGDTSGVGLGLTISRRGIEANGGTVSVRNIAGTGCIFTVRLPRAAAAADTPPA
jgi:signal transduction histidine kinase